MCKISHFAPGTKWVRLCLGLVRSLLTSTRFELNQKLLQNMFLRGIYLLERITAFDRPFEQFRLPVDVLAFGA